MYILNTLFSFQAHSLFNSIAVRKPKEDEWKIKAFELQKLYWGDNSSIDYETQGTLTNHLKSELEHIRDKYRVDIKLADELVSQFDSKTVDSDKQDEFCYVMRKLSSNCSEELRRFAQELNKFNGEIQNSMSSLQARFAALGDTWQDHEQAKFAQDFQETMKTLRRFVESSEQHAPFLLRKAQRIEDYLNQR